MSAAPPSTVVLRWDGPAATAAAAVALGRVARAGDMLGLTGDLGAGKTAFVQALAGGLGLPPEVRVTSPTFTLIQEYRGGRVPLYHADLYRLERERELEELGLDELIRRGDGLTAVEWSDRFRVLPRDHLRLAIAVTGPSERAAEVEAGGRRSRALLEAWLAAMA